MKKIFWATAILGAIFLAGFAQATEEKPPMPQFYKNGQSETPTVQELGGIATRPLRVLIDKNNKAHGDELVQVYATGTRVGDEFQVELGKLAPGMRATVYKLLRGPDGSRYFTMPMTVYSGDAKPTEYREKIVSYRSEYLIVVYEKAGAPEKKSANQLYFEDCERNLSVTSIRPNFKFCSLKFRMKDLASDEGAFTKDVQELIDRFIEPQRIFVYRLWKWDDDAGASAQGSALDMDSTVDKKSK